MGNNDPQEENTDQNESLCQRESPPTRQLVVQAGPSQVLTSLKAQVGQIQLPLPILKCMLLTLPICPSLVHMVPDNTYKEEVTGPKLFLDPGSEGTSSSLSPFSSWAPPGFPILHIAAVFLDNFLRHRGKQDAGSTTETRLDQRELLGAHV